MRKSSFQRDGVSTEGTSSPVLGQDLERELLPSPLKMSKGTFCPGVVSSCAHSCVPEVHVECIWVLLQLNVLSDFEQKPKFLGVHTWSTPAIVQTPAERRNVAIKVMQISEGL